MNELAAALIRAQLAGALAILAVLAVRPAARRAFGPEVAYGLWAAPLLAAFAVLLPGRTAEGASATASWAPGGALAEILLAAWAAGVAVVLALQWRRQATFMRTMRAGTAGPAVIGVICPRLVMPADTGLYAASEWALIRAHELEHIARRDPLAQAFVVAAQALAWFNPLAHLAARLARLDQEMACDASVLRERRGQRALYARTLLKTQLAGAPLALGCQWRGEGRGRGRHPLETRIAMLRSRAGAGDHPLGSTLVTAAVLAATAAAWLCQPPAPLPPGVQWPPAAPTPMILVDLTPPARR
jgi:beta-lactamase regulating signal transducer with metallopeptidase domain